ncbi:hypothetical protein BCR42DRAFT_342717 [Absidia repens]|uniref:Asteroid domain-containing protein n=1 Tax=Absidia repens TaxID=90262 RepID=A0A1X2IYM9_9FUNG|nr:hypothetical protein BCR42DRAFT_342717 [Absidia repens]
MGIHGLASFVQNYPSLNLQKAWAFKDASHNTDHLIFDGNAFVYHYAYLHREHWTHGGQYRYMAQVIQHTITALKQAGFALTFLFDGALPQDKENTRIKRYKDYVERTVLTMENLSPINAANKKQSTAFLLEGPQYRNDLYVIPPMTLEVCIQTLYELSVPVYICSGEADSVVAQYAEETCGYIVSKDSDMLVYPRCGKGYIPLDTLSVPSFNDLATTATLETTTDISIYAIVYQPQNLASLLRLDLHMLPLFGTLMGNDYMNIQVIKYPIMAWCSENAKASGHQLGSSQWPKCVAEFIRLMDQRSAAPGKYSSIISTIVSELEPVILGTNMSKKKEKVNTLAQNITDSVQRYIFEDLSASTPTQSPNTTSTTLSRHMSTHQYSRHVLDLWATQSFWGSIFLEDLQQESSWCVSRSLRQAMYRLGGMDQINEYVREKHHLTHHVISAANDLTLNSNMNFKQRQRLFLQLHHTSTPLIDTLINTVASPLRPLIVCLRYFIQQCINTGNPLADHEVVAILVASMIDLVPTVMPKEFNESDGPPYLTALGSAIFTNKTSSSAPTTANNGQETEELKIPSLKKRSIQLASQWQHTLLSSQYLSQVLLSTGQDTQGIWQHLQQSGVLASMYNGLVMHTCLQMGRLGASMGRMMLGASTKWMFLFGTLYDLVTGNSNGGMGRQVEKVFDYKFSKVTCLMDMEQRRSTISWMKSRILKKIEKQDRRMMINKSTTTSPHTKKSMKMTADGGGVRKSSGNAFSVLSSGCHFDDE